MASTTQSVQDQAEIAPGIRALSEQLEYCCNCCGEKRWHDALGRCVGPGGIPLGSQFCSDSPGAICGNCKNFYVNHDALGRCLRPDDKTPIGTMFTLPAPPRIVEARPARLSSQIVYNAGESPFPSLVGTGLELHVTHEAATRMRAFMNPFAEGAR